MANLQPEQIKELFDKPKNSGQIERCKKQHDRLKFHIHPTLDPRDAAPARAVFLEWVKGYLPEPKYKKFEQLLTLPVPTVDLTSEIFSELGRALEGENGFESFEFRQEALEEDFLLYRQQIKESDFWNTKGWDAFKTAINSLVVVDLPLQQLGPLPEPYFYLLEVELLHDVDLDYNGKVEYVIFNEGPLLRYVFDETFYRVYSRQKVEDQFILTSEIQHSWYDANNRRVAGLGYCPAVTFWNQALGDPANLQRKGSLTNALARLDKFVFWDVSTEYYQSYGTYPIYWEYLNDCDYSDNFGNECKGGFIQSQNLKDNTVLLDKRPCPKCQENRYVGAGSIKRIEPPADNGDADLREPAGIIKVDIEALKNAQIQQEIRREYIIRSCVGAGGEPENDQAKNVKQVQSSFESRHNVLMNIRNGFQSVKKWTLETLAILRYGENYLGCTVLLGDEFYLVDENQIAESYRRDKEAGLPSYHLAAVREMLYQTKYKNNPATVQRMQILAHLEPYPDKTEAELINIASKFPEVIDPALFDLKLNFDSYVKRFEAEEMDILRFGMNTSFSKKISSIKQKLLSYGNRNQNQRNNGNEQGSETGSQPDDRTDGTGTV